MKRQVRPDMIPTKTAESRPVDIIYFEWKVTLSIANSKRNWREIELTWSLEIVNMNFTAHFA